MTSPVDGAVLPRAVVIDDDPAIAQLLALMLRDQAQVTPFTSPRDAVAAILADPPRLVITDHAMPEWNGERVLRELRAHHDAHHLPVIVLSAAGGEDQILRCFQAGANDYLVKPAQKGELRAKVSLLIARSRAAALAAEEGDSLVGHVFAGYDVVSRLGGGGVGEVFRARAPDGSYVALKVLHPEVRRDRDTIARFFREAQHLKSVSHPNVARFHDMGHHDGNYFLAMEHVDGEPLSARLGQPLPDAEVVDMGLQVGAALGALHARGLTHRDIKPQNILRAQDGTLKLVDFGLARGPGDVTVTQKNVLIGTPAFLAPETITRGVSDIRTDLYALGALLYQAATGKLPFLGDTAVEVMMQHQFDAPVPPARHRASLSPALEQVILRLLAKDPAERFGEPAQLVAALRPLA